MRLDLSFWRFVIHFNIAKSGLWAKDGDIYLLHLGTFTDGKNTALKLTVLPLTIMIGFIPYD